MTKGEFCCEKKEQQNYEKEQIQRRTDHCHSPRGRRGDPGQSRLRQTQLKRGHVLQVAFQVWRHGSERSSAPAGDGRGERPLEASGGRPSHPDSNTQGGKLKKMVSPSSKRRAIKLAIEMGAGTTAQAYRALGLARSSYYRQSVQSEESRQRHGEIVQLSQDHPRYGYRRVTAVLRRQGHEINAKRVQRVRRKEGLQVSRRQRKLRRLGVSTAERQRARQANDVWS